MTILVIEGNISAGKSTLANVLGERLGFQVFLEPVVDNPYLELFYENPKKYALKMQLWFIRQRYQTYKAAVEHILNGGKGVILDRSIYSDWVFAEKNRIDNNICHSGFQIYTMVRGRLLESLPTPDLILHLDVTPKECFRRVHDVRARACESTIPESYLRGLGECYEIMLEFMENCGVPTLRVDWEDFGRPDHVSSLVEEKLSSSPRPAHLSYRIRNVETLLRPLPFEEAEEAELDAEVVNEMAREIGGVPFVPEDECCGDDFSQRLLVAQPISPTKC